MKIKKYIYFIAAIILLSSCIRESLDTTDLDLETRGLMQVEVVQENGDAADKMKTVRFFVFKNPYTSPELELNEIFNIPAGTDGEVSAFKITLEVSRKANSITDKMVVAVINEPVSLANITTYHQLHTLELDFSTFLNGNHSVQGTELLPMTGVAWTNKIYPTPEEAEATPQAITVARAVARVELYLRKDPGVTIDLTTASKVELKKTYNKEPFLYHTTGTNTFGRIQTVPVSELLLPENTKEWQPAATIPGSDIPDTGEGVLLCSFYTPERTCTAADNTDKLSLSINLITADGTPREGEIILDKFVQEGNVTEEEIQIIRRNNSYRVIATVEQNSIIATCKVVIVGWNEEYIEPEFY